MPPCILDLMIVVCRGELRRVGERARRSISEEDVEAEEAEEGEEARCAGPRGPLRSLRQVPFFHFSNSEFKFIFSPYYN